MVISGGLPITLYGKLLTWHPFLQTTQDPDSDFEAHQSVKALCPGRLIQ